MYKGIRYLGNRLVILSVIGVVVHTHQGNFLPSPEIEESSTSSTINLLHLNGKLSATQPWFIAARDDRQRECRFLGICDT